MSIQLICPVCETSLPESSLADSASTVRMVHAPSVMGWEVAGRSNPPWPFPDRSLSWEQAAVAPWRLLPSGDRPLEPFLGLSGIFWIVMALPPAVLWSPAGSAWESFWSGEPAAAFPGLARILDQCYRETKDAALRKELEAYREEVPCSDCGGSRLRREARAVRLEGLSIVDLTSRSVGAVLPVLPVDNDRPSDGESLCTRDRRDRRQARLLDGGWS